MSLANPTWHLRRMHPEDIIHADNIRNLVGWNQTVADWRRLLALAPHGCFVAELGGLRVGTVTTTRYSASLAWIGMLLVHPDHRRKGIGSALLQQALHYLQGSGVDCMALDATPAGQILYTGAGFTPVWALARWQGERPQLPPPLPGVQTTAIAGATWPAMAALDCQSFGVARPTLLQALAAQSSRAVVATNAEARVLGFGMIRSGAHAQMLGPLVAVNADIAAHLVAALFTDLSPGAVLWDIPESNQAAVRLADSLGFRRQRTLTRMAYGVAYPAHDPQLLYGIADLATG